MTLTKRVYLSNGDRVEVGSWALARLSGQLISPVKIVEIVAVNSVGRICAILVQKYSLGGEALPYRLPKIEPWRGPPNLSPLVLLPPKVRFQFLDGLIRH